jgi:hypothetical protein
VLIGRSAILKRLNGGFQCCVLSAIGGAFTTWARLMHRNSDMFYKDAMITATAKVYGLTVANRNVADFRALGFEVFNPFGPVDGSGPLKS